MGVIAIYTKMGYFKMQSLQKYGGSYHCLQTWGVTVKR